MWWYSTFALTLSISARQPRAPARQTSSSARPPCTASPSCGSATRTPTVPTAQTRLIVVSCGGGKTPLRHNSHPLHLFLSEMGGRIWFNLNSFYTWLHCAMTQSSLNHSQRLPACVSREGQPWRTAVSSVNKSSALWSLFFSPHGDIRQPLEGIQK